MSPVTTLIHSRSGSCLLIDQSVPAPEQSVLAREQAEAFSACVSSGLSETTARAAMNLAARRTAAGAISASAVALAHDVSRSMLFPRLKLAGLILFLIGVMAARPGEGEPYRHDCGY